ncbi:MAG: SUF system NifU family Fe-S cluster assembly protein [Gammaproteobacteria bacterium]|nr:SUF system NifU family Fe-S cluster assembly protein [Gammaproteobacteria bacterium]
MTDSAAMTRLYRDAVLAHSQAPHNFGAMASADCQASATNALCGDHFTVYLRLSRDPRRIVGTSFDGHGCAISMASASLLTDLVHGMSEGEALDTGRRFAAAMSGPGDSEVPEPLRPLTGVRDYPARIRCALLPWAALERALRPADESN